MSFMQSLRQILVQMIAAIPFFVAVMLIGPVALSVIETVWGIGYTLAYAGSLLTGLFFFIVYTNMQENTPAPEHYRR